MAFTIQDCIETALRQMQLVPGDHFLSGMDYAVLYLTERNISGSQLQRYHNVESLDTTNTYAMPEDCIDVLAVVARLGDNLQEFTPFDKIGWGNLQASVMQGGLLQDGMGPMTGMFAFQREGRMIRIAQPLAPYVVGVRYRSSNISTQADQVLDDYVAVPLIYYIKAKMAVDLNLPQAQLYGLQYDKAQTDAKMRGFSVKQFAAVHNAWLSSRLPL